MEDGRDTHTAPRLVRGEGFLEFRFTAFGGPCSLLLDRASRAQALELGGCVHREALRIQAKYSRYEPDSVLSAWNRGDGTPVELDDESAALLDLAALAHELGGGRFDITCGVLRRAWNFPAGGTMPAPDPGLLEELLSHTGWHRLAWDRPWLTMPAGMELDLGGLGKEYAVDRCLALVTERWNGSALVNFGGDLASSGRRGDGSPWRIGVEDPAAGTGSGPEAALTLELASGGLATSGDARRFVIVDGRRCGHILDPATGWPVAGAPRSVTVAADTCSQAGLLATLAMLAGPGAETFLAGQQVPHWILRDP